MLTVMAYRSDVIRGIRLAALLFGLVLCGITLYRVVRVEFVHAPPPPAAPSPPDPLRPEVTATPPAPVLASAAEPSKPARRTSRPKIRAVAAEIEMPVEQDQAEKPVEDQGTAANQESAAQPEDKSAEPESTSQEDPPVVKPESRTKRALKAVVRFIKPGREKPETPAQPVREFVRKP